MYNLEMNKNVVRVLKGVILTTSIFTTMLAEASVSHKTAQLDSYLNQISGNQDEKSDNFIDIIKNKKQGTYLDIGSGRDTIPNIIENVLSSKIDNVRLIAGDLEGKTLTEIAKKYPQLLDLDDMSHLKLSLAKMDATEMHKIPDSSVKAINASAVLHEVNSYVPSKTPIDRFFLESIRILEKDGFLIYRDPTLQALPDEINSLELKTDFAKKFLILFLPKFLDNKFTKMVDMYGKSIKPNFSYQDKIKITLYLKDDDKAIHLNFSEFFALPTNDIDFDKRITIDGPRRLLSEFERHYVLFVKNVYPVNFISDDKIRSGSSLLSITDKLAQNCVASYLQNIGVNFNNTINIGDINNIKSEKTKIDNIVSNGLHVNATDKINYNKLLKFFGKYNVSSDLYKLGDNKIWLDAKLIPVIYSHFPEIVGGKGLPVESLMWLEREGEEYYFYYTPEQLLSYLEKFCDYYLKGTDKEGYVLHPTHNGGIKNIDRTLYRKILERDMLQIDKFGRKQEFITSKTVITFQLVSKRSIK